MISGSLTKITNVGGLILTEQDKNSLTKTAGSVYDSLSEEAKNILATMSHGADLTATNLPEDQKEILNNLFLCGLFTIHIRIRSSITVVRSCTRRI